MAPTRTVTITDRDTQTSKIVEITRNYPTGEIGRIAKDTATFMGVLTVLASVAMLCVGFGW